LLVVLGSCGAPLRWWRDSSRVRGAWEVGGETWGKHRDSQTPEQMRCHCIHEDLTFLPRSFERYARTRPDGPGTAAMFLRPTLRG